MKFFKNGSLIIIGIIVGITLGYFIIWHHFPLIVRGEEFGTWAEWISGLVGATGILVSLWIAFSKEKVNILVTLDYKNCGRYQLTIMNVSSSVLELFPVVKKHVSIFEPEKGIYRFDSVVEEDENKRKHNIQLKFTNHKLAKLTFINIITGRKITIRMRKKRDGQWVLWRLKFLD